MKNDNCLVDIGATLLGWAIFSTIALFTTNSLRVWLLTIGSMLFLCLALHAIFACIDWVVDSVNALFASSQAERDALLLEKRVMRRLEDQLREHLEEVRKRNKTARGR